MRNSSVLTVTMPHTEQSQSGRGLHLYYPDEGFGNVYRRVITNHFFADLVRHSNIRTVAEVPLDPYGIVGAGSLIFTQLGTQVTLISDDKQVLDRAEALMSFNSVTDVSYLHSSIYKMSVPDDAFDFTWNFDRLQTLTDPARFLRELCRISKATMVSVPNASTYGQYPHYVYHLLTRTTCEYVGPRAWMLRAPIRKFLQHNGMQTVKDGVIDVPWWPGFPELPNLARRLIGRPPVEVQVLDGEVPEVNPHYVPSSGLSALRRKVKRSAFIELGRFSPTFLKVLFAHNVYVIGCKPRYREELGL